MLKNELSLQISEITDTNSPESFGILCVTDGNITLTRDSNVYNLGVGDTVFFANDEFYYIHKGDAEYIFISFGATGEILSELSGLAVELEEEEMLLVKKIDLLINSVNDTVSKQQIFSMLELLLLLCSKRKSISVCEDKNAVLFSKAVDILKSNINSNVSVSDLADKINISLSNLKRLFAQYTNIGVHEYYTFLKIARAKELLRQGETVTATAQHTGFANQAYFSAAFKRITGTTPKEYAGNKKALESRAKSAQPQKTKELPSYLL